MSPDEKLRLTHIAEAAALIADYVKGGYRKNSPLESCFHAISIS